ncbi:hypothetical protein MCOR02_007715 [Pyricularia oryzae]|nr:hypothetical protein MCOR01_006628 [Pyricularia oryzae]KAH9433044.1 hypothetical protein MCOR02_007715 [Pyricularia oryzae]KAI6573102.1 hypothetical protein MCOR09_003091 [Pyricularia oryzae]
MFPLLVHSDHLPSLTSRPGAITTAGLVMNGWDIEKCLATFKQLSHTAFQRRASLKIPLISAVLQFLISIICDGRYPPKNLESVLQRVFGRKGILDSSAESEMGILAGIIVTSIKDTSASVFTNYNAVGNRKNYCDYSVMTTDPAARPLLWEIIRCATAAPLAFWKLGDSDRAWKQLLS